MFGKETMDEIQPERITTEINAQPESPKKGSTAWLIIIAVLLIGLLIAGIVILSQQPQEVTSKVRDIFIILLAVEMFIIGVAMIVLIVQLASLSNLLQNEVKPILDSTTETVNNLKGTVKFLSDNVTEPVIKLYQSMAGINRLLQMFKIKK
jgi:NADH:ubiquinone oxidoreductase subunit K